ncbi:hypothetical protein GJ496_011165 [Pomphorhynchus laevis]|nr:hypothetical protein GJ496_011165 [Pomphorhynchus laevis]
MMNIQHEDQLSHSSSQVFDSKSSSMYQCFLDSIVPFVVSRWVVLLTFVMIFMLRVVLLQGFYIIAYVYWIFFLNQFILFLSPKFDSTGTRIFSNDELPPLPTQSSDEFRPFMRRLPEFKFWLYCMYATLISTACTFAEMFNIPVFWPILVMYFFTLFFVTMRRQISHMIRYKYIPFTYGKVRYNTNASSNTIK